MRYGSHSTPYAAKLRPNEDVCIRTGLRITKPEPKPVVRLVTGRILKPAKVTQ